VSHDATTFRASGHLGGWYWAYECGECPDVVHPNAQAAAIAAATHVLDNRPAETPA
jgi:hypothetical protein